MSTSFCAAELRFKARRPCCTMPSSFHAPVACSSFDVGQAKKQQPADAEAGGFFRFAHGFVDRKVEDAGHGTDGSADAFSRANKERVYEVARIERSLADKRTELLSSAQPAHAIFGETHRKIVRQRAERARTASG